MELDQLITASGISPTALSSDVKGAMQRVLETAGYKVVQEVLALLNVKAAQAGGTSPTTTTLDDKAVQDALAEIAARDAEKAKRRRGLYYLLGGIGLIATVLTVLIIRHRKRHPHG
ncbi:hypothetical protein [Fibrella forsythiae]|uniref:DUF3618 domain-containing protein n=1 Tax=Fibrella forsythiae TaxID=2817061 RepID=A0ABS3JP60_9BACT|nr:hypothetical protein [Fibrella forsythiae]MBO0951196.1 hypothetical protein [Fibrella forsythiae]